MNSHLSLTKHASGSSGGTLQELSQKVGWRDSLARWSKVGLLAGVALGSALPTMGLAGNMQVVGGTLAVPTKPTKPAIPTIGTGVIQGVKFNDLNGNGTKDPGEKGLAYEIINLRSADGTTFKSLSTDLNGNYSFGGLELDNYTIWTGVYPTDWAIAGEADWQQTTPEKGEFPPDHLVTLSADNAIINFGTWNGVEVNLDFVVDAGGNHAIESGEKVNYQGTFLDANSEGKHTVVWDFGDGNSKKQIVDGSTGVRKAVRAITAAIPIRANNMPAETGTLTTTATVTAANGNTATDTTTTIVRDNKTDPCAAGVPTVQSVKSGDWSDPNTWSPATVPDSKAWVIISAGTTVTLKEPPVTDSSKAYPVKGLCVGKNATLTSAANSYGQPVTWVAIQATNIHNQGTIKGPMDLMELIRMAVVLVLSNMPQEEAILFSVAINSSMMVPLSLATAVKILRGRL